MNKPDLEKWFRDLSDIEWEMVEEKCFSCGGKGATGPGTTKGCCIWHQPIGIIRCNHCDGSGKIKMPRPKEKKQVTTRCKVHCTMIQPVDFGNGKTGQSAYFYATYDSDPESENGKFFNATPCASFQVGTTNGTPFEAGKSYYVDFTQVEPSVPAEATAS